MSKVDELLWQMWLDEHGEEDFDEHKTKIKQAIQALIADQMAEYQAQLLKDYKEDIATAVREARQQAIEDVKKAGYGYDDGSGFVLKISFAELAQLKEESK